jgi:hypothetical protein
MSFCSRSSIPILTSLIVAWLSSGLAHAQEQSAISNAPDQTAGTSDSGVTADDDHLHLLVTGYLWTPGMHGTVGSHGYDAGVRASAGQLLSHFHLGLMGVTEIRKQRLLSTIDLMWVNLADSAGRATPFPEVPTLSARVGFNQIVLTPKVGFRVINNKYFTIDGLAGIRYWNLGSTLQFTPAPLGGSGDFSKNQSWVDPTVGLRFQAPLNNFVSFTLAGDVGGWGAGAQMDYQILGALGFKLKPRVVMDVGWRYLFVNYRSSNFVYEAAETGFVLGVTFDALKPR